MKFALQTIFAIATVILFILLVVWSIMWFAGLMTGWLPFWALIGIGVGVTGFMLASHIGRETSE